MNNDKIITMSNSLKTVLVFGTFDALHPGHEYFLEQSSAYGDRLVVVVARDSFVRSFKKKEPRHNELSRLHFIQSHPLVSEACLADEVTGSFTVLNRIRPTLICLGHDQNALEDSMRKWMKSSGQHYKIKVLKSYKREKYSSTLLNEIRNTMHYEEE